MIKIFTRDSCGLLKYLKKKWKILFALNSKLYMVCVCVYAHVQMFLHPIGICIKYVHDWKLFSPTRHFSKYLF